MRAEGKRLFNHLWVIAGGVPISAKILGMGLGLVLLLGLGITIQVRLALNESMNRQLEDQSISATRDLAARATDLILLNDRYALLRLLQDTQQNNANFTYAFILDHQGRVLVSTFGETFPLDLISLNSVDPQEHHHSVLIQTDQGLVWDTAVPVLEGSAGVTRVGISDAGVRQAVASVTGQILLTTVLVSLVGVTFAGLLTWLLTRPVLELVDATRDVAKGNFGRQVRRWANDEVGVLTDAFNHMTVELSRLDELRQEREKLRRQLLEKVIATQEEERKRIARELHDSTSQSLTSLIVSLRLMETNCSDPLIQGQAQELRQIAAQTLDEVHSLALRLRPQVLDDLGLAAALERLVTEWQTRYKIPVDMFIHNGDQRLPEALETALYRIVQEALTNIARHSSSATTASVLIEARGQAVVAVIEDDGVGFDPGNGLDERQLGLLGMRERAELLGGRLTIESAPGKGTSVFVEIPLNSAGGVSTNEG
jgi:signal transduction histidine kinase